MPLGQVILNAEYCPGDCSQTVTGHPAVSQVALKVDSHWRPAVRAPAQYGPERARNARFP